MTVTFGDILRANKGIGPGFDFARIALAASVLGWHVPEVMGNEEFTSQPVLWLLRDSALPMFFGLSGFLIAGSAQRLDLKNFFLNRGFRIVPALFVEIFLSALVLGVIFTNLQLSEYFWSKGLYEYFLNLIGYIHYRLPGVFENLAKPTVNGSLWTIPFEIGCYIVMGLLVATGFAKRGLAFLLLAPALILVSTVAQFGILPHITSQAVQHAFYITYMHGGAGVMLLPCFLLGAALYNYRDKVPVDARIFAACVGTLLCLGFLFTEAVWSIGPLALVFCPLQIYIVCFVGMINFPRIPYYSRGDYSYGIYLYGYPLQQTIRSVLPSMDSYLLNFVVGLFTATMFATLSWHFFEKPALRLRKGLSFATRLEAERAHPRTVGTVELSNEVSVTPEVLPTGVRPQP